jgi:hypothetical protein
MAETRSDCKYIAKVTGKLRSIMVRRLGIQPLWIFTNGECDDYNPYYSKSNVAMLLFLLPDGISGCLRVCCAIYWP